MKTGSLLFATQDQALCTRALQHVYSNSSTTQCRLCDSQAEAVEHLISGCSQLAGTQYKLQHYNVAKYIHWLLCGKYSIQKEPNWWKHKPASIMENDSVKIM